MMKITFLGTGTSQGVPVIACDCEVCLSTNQKDKRLRSSVLIESEETTVVIDTGPDFRQQMLREQVQKLDAVVYTHEHKDHVAGMDDVRAFNYKQKKDMDIYASSRVQEALIREFPYVFSEYKYPGVPQVKLHTVELGEPFSIGDLELEAIEVMHYKLPVYAYRIADFAYVTDANYIGEEEKEKLKGCEVLVINALRRKEHISHFTLDQALAMIEELKPQRAYLTHISHYMGLHNEVSKELPPNVEIAYDGLQLSL
jgi:phosphoribosyl 1,2-cyclic phosphate phosphodiesterase